MPSDKNIHSGHRDRVRNRFVKDGLDSFADHNILELIMFYSVPRKDTNELAHRLLQHFGSLSDVFDASVDHLVRVPGISYNTAVLIKLFPAVFKKYELSKREDGFIPETISELADYVAQLFIGESKEALYVISIDGNNRVGFCDKVSEGVVGSVSVDVVKIIESAIKHGAMKVALAHNHPHANARPSKADIAVTNKVAFLLKELGMRLEDHIIVGRNGKVTSMFEMGLIEYYGGTR